MRWSLFALVLTLLCVTATQTRAADEKCFEMRTYYAAPGKLNALLDRFRNHTLKLFAKHGMKLVGFWVPSEGPNKGKTLVYILEHASKEARDASFKAFRADPDWIKAKSESEVNGSLTEKVEEQFLSATDMSPIK